MSYVQSASLTSSPQPQDGSSGPTLRPFANLNLTEDQRSQIRAIFQKARSQGLTQSDVQSQINAILTPDQQTTLQSDLATLQQTQQKARRRRAGRIWWTISA